jgi:hypothetical protein
MGIAATYVQVPPLSELSGMAGGPGYFEAGGRGEQPSTYAATWAAPPGTDPWGLPPVDPQNYSGGGMPPAIAIYPGSIPVGAPIPVPAYPPQSPGAPLDARNYVPPDPTAAPFDARNYIPPDAQHSTYEPRTSESAFNNSMQLYGGSFASPVVPPASYLLSPQPSYSSGGSFPQSSPGLSRSMSTRTTEREAWLYDRPGTWRPRFQMPRSGVSSLLPNLTRGKNFPPGAYYRCL